MYNVIAKPKRMSREQISEEFQGKWVFLVGMEGPLYRPFESAIPIVIADKPFEGSETGIYKRLHDEHGEYSMDISFLPMEYNIFGFSEVLNDNS